MPGFIFGINLAFSRSRTPSPQKPRANFWVPEPALFILQIAGLIVFNSEAYARGDDSWIRGNLPQYACFILGGQRPHHGHTSFWE